MKYTYDTARDIIEAPLSHTISCRNQQALAVELAKSLDPQILNDVSFQFYAKEGRPYVTFFVDAGQKIDFLYEIAQKYFTGKLQNLVDLKNNMRIIEQAIQVPHSPIDP